MIPVPSSARVWIAMGKTDMRKGMASLARQVEHGLKHKPYCGDLFIFRGRRGDLCKILWHDGVGMSLYATVISLPMRRYWEGLRVNQRLQLKSSSRP